MGPRIPFSLFSQLIARYTRIQVDVHGARLRAVGAQIWVADREVILVGGMRLPIRMVVVGNRSGDLLCYSPVALDDATIEALSGIGEVRWIAAPHALCTPMTQQFMHHFPAAQLLAVPGTGAALIGMGLETRTVNLSGGFCERVIYHDLSETLIVSDLLLNIHSGGRALEWLLRMNGIWQQAGHTRLQRGLIMRDRQGLVEFYQWALARPFVQVTMSHGQVIGANAREIFYQVFHRYLPG
jgi:hypothetical protein